MNWLKLRHNLNDTLKDGKKLNKNPNFFRVLFYLKLKLAYYYVFIERLAFHITSNNKTTHSYTFLHIIHIDPFLHSYSVNKNNGH